MASTVLLAAAVAFAVLMELLMLPAFVYLLRDSRWSVSTVVGGLLFFVACANHIYCRCNQWLT